MDIPYYHVGLERKQEGMGWFNKARESWDVYSRQQTQHLYIDVNIKTQERWDLHLIFLIEFLQ